MNHAWIYRWTLGAMWLWATCPGLPAQSYLPLLNRSQWFVEQTGATGQQFDWYHIGKDSLIGGDMFREVIAAGLPTGIFVREDVAAEQIWVTTAERNWESDLLYDFTVVPGDTLELRFASELLVPFVVTSRDSVNTAMGFMRRLTLDRIGTGTPAQIRWAVGVGEDLHPFYLEYTQVNDPVFHLICNYQDRVKVFDDGFATCLPPPVVGAEEIALSHEDVLLFPNPTKGQLTLVLPEMAGEWRVTVVNICGVKIAEIEQRAARSLSIDLENWGAGLYLIQLVSPKGKMSIHSAVVQ